MTLHWQEELCTQPVDSHFCASAAALEQRQLRSAVLQARVSQPFDESSPTQPFGDDASVTPLTERSRLFTAFDESKTAATSGSRTTVTTRPVIREANRLGHVWLGLKSYSGRSSPASFSFFAAFFIFFSFSRSRLSSIDDSDPSLALRISHDNVSTHRGFPIMISRRSPSEWRGRPGFSRADPQTPTTPPRTTRRVSSDWHQPSVVPFELLCHRQAEPITDGASRSVRPPNHQAQQPGPLSDPSPTKSEQAAPVCCSAGFGR
jgi:hypothetical protein